MIVDHAYRGASRVHQGPDGSALGFAPDLTRPGVRFDGDLALALPFREAISALNAVVVSDLRFKPKDREAYMAWLAMQPLYDEAAAAGQRADLSRRLAVVRDELGELDARHRARHATYAAARQRYFNYLYAKAKDAWFVLDPVVTVHPDEVFFEAFSQDESSYGRLGVGYEAFGRLGERQNGTTNVDYSEGLYDEFQRIRSYKTTSLAVDPGGIDVVTTDSAAWREVKIDLPDSWVRGFLQVNAAMALPATRFSLDPLDVYNLCTVLAQHRETHGPRALRWVLQPGQPVVVYVEPWDLKVVCARSRFEGHQPHEIRTWGRRRLRLLERLLPLATGIDVHLLGSGMPSFFVARMGPLTFTLGLSGWTKHDWASAGASFDLLAPRRDVDAATRDAVYKALATDWLATPDALAARLGLDRGLVVSGLNAWAQAGRVMYDLGAGVYRARALTRDPVPLDALRFATPREAEAVAFVDAGRVLLTEAATDARGTRLQGEVGDDDGREFPELSLDGDGAIIAGQCGCRFYAANALRQGPCAHLLALRLQHGRQVSV